MKRTRNITFEEYGIDEEMAEWLLKLCRLTDPEIRKMVHKAAELSNQELSRWIYKSLTEGLSYIQMETTDNPVPSTQKDFYGYRRKALSIFSTLYVKRLMFGDANEI